MGLGKKLKKTVKSVVKQAPKALATGGISTIKPLDKLAKKAYTVQAGMSPLGLIAQPEQLGIKNSKNQNLYDNTQKVNRIGSAIAGAVAGGMLLGPAAGAAPGVAGTAGTAGAAGTGGSFFSGLGGAKALLAGGSILAPMLMGNKENPNQMNGGPRDLSAGNFSWNPGGSNGVMTADQGLNTRYSNTPGLSMSDSYAPGSPESLQLSYLQQMMQAGGLTPELRAQRKNRAIQDIRSAQADRGMFNSGLGLQQEAYMMPEIDARLNDIDFSRYNTMFGMLDPMAQRRFQSGMADKEMSFRSGQADLDRQYGLQSQYNNLLYGRAGQEDQQDFLARMNYQNQQNQMWNNIGAAGMNYFLK